MKECSECKKPHDFDKECSGSCSTCNKMFLCCNCCYTHECLPGKSRQLRIIINPTWICNLRKNLNPEIPNPQPTFEEIAKQMRINADCLMKEITQHTNKEIERLKLTAVNYSVN